MVTDLEPGTVYEYELIGYAASGRPIVLETGNFSTVARESLVPPNVQNLWAEVSGVDVELWWTIPPDTTIDRVRVVRSHLGFSK
jgi:hypothetical protein